ncbi:MAG: prephenate dehydratase [Pirellulales bacterium]
MKRASKSDPKSASGHSKPASKPSSAGKPSSVKSDIKSQGPSGTTSLAELDRRLLELLAERVAATRAELESTRARGDTIDLRSFHDAALNTVREQATALGLVPERAAEWMKHVVSLSFEQSHFVEPIAYLGPIYSYSYLAAVQHFGTASQLVPVATIEAVFDELLRGQAVYGVVPIENSTDGRVVDTLGMFARLPFKICGEVHLPIHHCLLGRSARADITEVYSKPQAMSQCRGWLSKHLPDARLIEISSTAAAARLAAEKPGTAAVASREAGIHHGLQIIDENIEDNAHNVTRFAVIGNRDSEPTGTDKTSLMFQLKHQPGALAEAMVIFQKAKLNLTWIESFPLADHPREYLFFVELEGHVRTKNVANAVEQLRKQTLRLEVLGSYPAVEEQPCSNASARSSTSGEQLRHLSQVRPGRGRIGSLRRDSRGLFVPPNDSARQADTSQIPAHSSDSREITLRADLPILCSLRSSALALRRPNRETHSA